jgi:hypothetical protein
MDISLQSLNAMERELLVEGLNFDVNVDFPEY